MAPRRLSASRESPFPLILYPMFSWVPRWDIRWDALQCFASKAAISWGLTPCSPLFRGDLPDLARKAARDIFALIDSNDAHALFLGIRREAMFPMMRSRELFSRSVHCQ